MPKHRRHIRNLLLDWRYQLHYTLVIVLIAALLTAGLGFFWYREVQTNSRMISAKELTTLTTVSSSEAMELEQDIADQDRERLLILVAFGILLGLVIAGYGISMTHRVAGPLHKITRHMKDIGEGKLYPLWEVRQKDQLQQFWQVFKTMHVSLRQQMEIEAQDLAQIARALEMASEASAKDDETTQMIKQQASTLRRLAARKSESLTPLTSGEGDSTG
jgi:methyl-accepting chemotaxis protein